MSDRISSEAESRLEAIFDAAVFGIVTIDQTGIIEDLNPAVEQIFGYKANQLVGKNVSCLMPEPYRSGHDGFLAHYLNTGEKKIIGIGREIEGQRADGSIFPAYLTVSEVPLNDRLLFTGMIQDISDRKTAENQVKELQNELIHVARLSAMGELASALAHELNQPLTAISNYAQAARRIINDDPSKGEAAAGLLLKASDQAIRAGDIIRRLRQFIEWGETDRSWHDLSPMADEAAQLGLVGAKTKGVSFDFQAAENLPKVMIDRVQIQQVIQNLVRNAVDAFEDWDGQRQIVLTITRQEKTVNIGVSDTGPGISPEVESRLFEPFVTTKPSGMGIGLSVCRNIIESHGGKITCQRGSSGGTTFQFSLPIDH